MQEFQRKKIKQIRQILREREASLIQVMTLPFQFKKVAASFTLNLEYISSVNIVNIYIIYLETSSNS
jgi:hypothetical protein